jgi:hypothetical protein
LSGHSVQESTTTSPACAPPAPAKSRMASELRSYCASLASMP